MPFVKGKSGNPGGRPGNLMKVREMAAKHTKKAVDTLVAMLDSESDKVKVAAAEALLDRAYGKPTQPVAGDDSMPPILINTVIAGMTDEEVAKLAGE